MESSASRFSTWGNRTHIGEELRSQRAPPPPHPTPNTTAAHPPPLSHPLNPSQGVVRCKRNTNVHQLPKGGEGIGSTSLFQTCMARPSSDLSAGRKIAQLPATRPFPTRTLPPVSWRGGERNVEIEYRALILPSYKGWGALAPGRVRICPENQNSQQGGIRAN